MRIGTVLSKRYRLLGFVLAAVTLAPLAANLCNSYAGEILFHEATKEAGLLESLQGLMGHGGAWGDVDGDGDLDLYVGGFADRPDAEYAPANGPVGSQLFINDNGKFRVADNLPTLYARTSGAVFVDLDNDGALELYVANNAKPGGKPNTRGMRQAKAQPQRSVLYQQRSGQWIDISEASGACPQGLHTARNVVILDYDADGLLDLLLIEDRFRKDPHSVLLRNEGNLEFRDVTAKAGLPNDLFGLGHAVADLNDDGRPDIFIGHSNRFFLSQGDGTYIEPEGLKALFAWQPLHGEDWPCGAALGDLNGDGLLDLVLSIHCETARNKLYLNRGLQDGVPQFEDVTAKAGWPDSIPAKAPHVELYDFDNDGLLDVHLTAGWLDSDGAYRPLIYRNTGTNKDGVPQFAATHESSSPMVYFPAGPAADVNNDGRVDLFLINWFTGNHCRLLLNQTASGNWLDITVTGRSFNKMGIGSQVKVFEAGEGGRLLGTQEIQVGCGYASGGPAVVHFGLGKTEFVDIEVRLPNGEVVRRKQAAVNQRLSIEE
ncbi:MAG: CRTAC1 family protein [Planctomycetaceae bacterium]